MTYIKPETLIVKIEPYNLMIGSCTCKGHCSCGNNENPHSAIDKCHCSNRPVDIENIYEEY